MKSREELKQEAYQTWHNGCSFCLKKFSIDELVLVMQPDQGALLRCKQCIYKQFGRGRLMNDRH